MLGSLKIENKQLLPKYFSLNIILGLYGFAKWTVFPVQMLTTRP